MGFRAEGVTTALTTASRARYPNDDSLRLMMKKALAGIGAIPGVESAGVTSTIPYAGYYSDSVVVAEGYVMKPGESVISPLQVTVTPGYFETMSVRLVRGRYFTEADDDHATRVVIVDERLARRFWGESEAVGRRMFLPDSPNLTNPGPNTRWLRVVGVVRFVRLEDLTGNRSPNGAYYFPYAQNPVRGIGISVRARGDSAAVGRRIREAMLLLDPEMAVFGIRGMPELLDLSLATRRTSLLLALSFAILALLLSALGIYGVLAYLVTQRSREIGIRMALGSTPGGIRGLVAGEGMVMAGVGLGIGLIGSYLLRRVVQQEIYGIQPFDPAVLAAAGLVLGSVGLLACLLPAGRAARVNPVVVLNQP